MEIKINKEIRNYKEGPVKIYAQIILHINLDGT